MSFLADFFHLPLKQKIFVLAAIGAWWLSIQFSHAGFALESQEFAWVGWALAVLVTVGELAFNDRQTKPTVTIIFIGLVAYAYGVYTNVVGFWAARHPGIPFDWFSVQSVMSWGVGCILEIAPEPLLLLAFGRARDADPLGELSDLISGKLTQSQHGQHNQNPNMNSQMFRPLDHQNGPITEPKINVHEMFQKNSQHQKQGKSHNPHNPRWNQKR